MEQPLELLVEGPSDAKRTVVLAHGAGAPMDSPFMQSMSDGLTGTALRVARFDFPYMERRHEREGRRGPPDSAKVLQQRFRSVIDALGPAEELVIGGKSLGGRMASMIADDVRVLGLVCLGYPFHPPGRPERLRVAHLRELRTPTLIVQGTRDALGNREEIAEYELSPAIRLEFLEDGDHSFKPRVRSGRTLAQNMQQAVEAVAGFVSAL